MDAKPQLQNSWRESTTSKWEVPWEVDDDVTNCRLCNKKFRIYRRRHHCRACGRIFCSKCCRDWIALPEHFNMKDPQRCCFNCVKECGTLDWSRKEDVSGPEDAETVIMLPPYLMTRKSLIYLSELMDKKLRIISMDLPGLGTRRGERLMMSSTVSAIKDTIERYCPDKKAFILGFGVGGYAAMVFGRMHPTYCKGIVLSGASSEYPPFKGTIYTNAVGAVFKMTPDDEQWKIIPETFSYIPRERINRAVLRDGIDYSQWGPFSDMVKESKQGFYVECLTKMYCKVMILNAEHDFRDAEDAFINALGENGTLEVVNGADCMMFIDSEYVDKVADMITRFVLDNA